MKIYTHTENQQQPENRTLVKNNKKSIEEVANHNVEKLFEVRSLFPFDFFPATITIDMQKVSIVNQLFFFSKQVVSIPITEIFVVECDTNLLFGKIRIKDKRFDMEPIEVEYLPKHKAREARRIIQGLISVYDQQLDISGLSVSEVKENVEKIGKTYAGI